MSLGKVFEKLNQWIEEQNIDAHQDGLIPIAKCEFKVVGQTALYEAKLDLEIVATVDVDALTNATYSVLARFNELLKANGLEYDQLSNEIWMPEETKYIDIYRGTWITALRAEPEFIMVSKAKMALEKNKGLLRQYIASEPTKSFFALCQKYKVNIDRIVKG